MQFEGKTKSAKRESMNVWVAWCCATSGRPFLHEFAKRWVALMEPEASKHIPVRQIAKATMSQVQGEKYHWRGEVFPLSLYTHQIREVILILRQVWAFGHQLYVWGKKCGILSVDD